MRVDAAVGEEAHEVQRRAAVACVPGCGDEDGVAEEVAVLDRLVDPREVLVDDAARAEVGVADF